MQPAHEPLQRLAVAGLGHGSTNHVAHDVEILVFDPARAIDIERRRREFILEAFREVDTLAEEADHTLKEIARVVLGKLDDGHASDVHRALGRLGKEKRGIDNGKLPNGGAHRRVLSLEKYSVKTLKRLATRPGKPRTLTNSGQLNGDCASTGNAPIWLQPTLPLPKRGSLALMDRRTPT